MSPRPAGANRRSRSHTGDGELDSRLVSLVADTGATRNTDLLFEMLAAVVGMAQDDLDRLDLKIAGAALREMREAYNVFDPYRGVPKITIFGSARTLPDDPLYLQARDLAAALSEAGWMVVTGAGPGIMAAGAEGAGRARSIGVNIRLPMEQEANPHIASDPKLVVMKYFFTRKLMLMKESAGFAVLPGGFGTLDETFELLTLLQTGKAAPAPVVLIDVPQGTYWAGFDRFVSEELARGGLVGRHDGALYRMTDDVATAMGEILGFYRNYHSSRHVGNLLVLRLRAAPTDEEIAALNEEFSDICLGGRIRASGALPPEVTTRDHVELPRLALPFDRVSHGRLRMLIDRLNGLPSAPAAERPDAGSVAAAGLPPLTDAEEEEGPNLPRELQPVLLRAADGDNPGLQVLAAHQLRLFLELAGRGAAATRHDEVLLAEGLRHATLDYAEIATLVAELARMVPLGGSIEARTALIGAVAAGPADPALDLLLELLAEHAGGWGPAEHRELLQGVDRLVPGDTASRLAERATEEQRSALAVLSGSPDAAVARAARRLLGGR